MSTPVSDRPITRNGAAAAEAATAAFAELRRLVGLLAEELAGFRRRAIAAEARVKELEQALEQAKERAIRAEALAEAGTRGGETPTPREAALARENEQLRRRLDAASQRIRVLLERLRFIREQESQ